MEMTFLLFVERRQADITVRIARGMISSSGSITRLGADSRAAGLKLTTYQIQRFRPSQQPAAYQFPWPTAFV